LLLSSRAPSTYKDIKKPEFHKIGRIKAALYQDCLCKAGFWFC
jgi:hypothetical protein